MTTRRITKIIVVRRETATGPLFIAKNFITVFCANQFKYLLPQLLLPGLDLSGAQTSYIIQSQSASQQSSHSSSGQQFRSEQKNSCSWTIEVGKKCFSFAKNETSAPRPLLSFPVSLINLSIRKGHTALPLLNRRVESGIVLNIRVIGTHTLASDNLQSSNIIIPITCLSLLSFLTEMLRLQEVHISCCCSLSIVKNTGDGLYTYLLST